MKMTRKMKVVILGAIDSDPNYADKFKRAQRIIESKVDCVVLTSTVLPLYLNERDYMRMSLEHIDAADVAVFLPCWTRSAGARTEREYCKRTAKPFLDFEDEAAAIQCLLRLRPVLAARHAYDEQLNDLLRFALRPDPQTNGLGREAAQKLPIATKALLHATREVARWAEARVK